MLIDGEVAIVDVVNGFFNLAWQYVGKETKASHVDTNDRRTLASHLACSLKECTIATKRDDIVYIEVVAIKHSRSSHIYAKSGGKEVVERTIDINLGTFVDEI